MLYVGKACDFGFHVCAEETHERAFVSHLIAVVGCGEYGDHPAALLVLVALLFALVRTNQHFQVIIIEESGSHIGAELSADAALAGRPSIKILGVTPEHLTHDTCLWGFTSAICFLDFCKCDAVLAEESTVADHHFFIDNHREWQLAEHLAEKLVLVLSVLGSHLTEKAVHFIKRRGLVVSSGHVHVLGQANFPHNQGQDNLD